VIDAVVETHYSASKTKKMILQQKKELDRLTNRGYSTGFLLGTEPPHDFSGLLRTADFSFVGEILGEKNGMNIVRVHNALYKKDKLEVITPAGNFPIKIKNIFDKNNKEISEAHGGHRSEYYFQFDRILKKRDLIRKKHREI
jgi:hypothetical protein